MGRRVDAIAAKLCVPSTLPQLFKERLGLIIEGEDEMACMVEGCNFLLNAGAPRSLGVRPTGNPGYSPDARLCTRHQLDQSRREC